MHVTACLAEQKVEVEVGEDCRSLQALREAIVEALPQLCVEGFDVSVGGRALDDDEGVVSLEENASLDLVPNSPVRTRPSVRALREAGREVSEDELLKAARAGNVSQVTLYLNAGVPIACVNGSYVHDSRDSTPLHSACRFGHSEVAALLLEGGTAIDVTDGNGRTPLHVACFDGYLAIATLLLDRGSRAINATDGNGLTPLHHACYAGYLEVARLLLDRGSTAIDATDGNGLTPLYHACFDGDLER